MQNLQSLQKLCKTIVHKRVFFVSIICVLTLCFFTTFQLKWKCRAGTWTNPWSRTIETAQCRLGTIPGKKDSTSLQWNSMANTSKVCTNFKYTSKHLNLNKLSNMHRESNFWSKLFERYLSYFVWEIKFTLSERKIKHFRNVEN